MNSSTWLNDNNELLLTTWEQLSEWVQYHLAWMRVEAPYAHNSPSWLYWPVKFLFFAETWIFFCFIAGALDLRRIGTGYLVLKLFVLVVPLVFSPVNAVQYFVWIVTLTLYPLEVIVAWFWFFYLVGWEFLWNYLTPGDWEQCSAAVIIYPIVKHQLIFGTLFANWARYLALWRGDPYRGHVEFEWDEELIGETVIARPRKFSAGFRRYSDFYDIGEHSWVRIPDREYLNRRGGRYRFLYEAIVPDFEWFTDLLGGWLYPEIIDWMSYRRYEFNRLTEYVFGWIPRKDRELATFKARFIGEGGTPFKETPLPNPEWAKSRLGSAARKVSKTLDTDKFKKGYAKIAAEEELELPAAGYRTSKQLLRLLTEEETFIRELVLSSARANAKHTYRVETPYLFHQLSYVKGISYPGQARRDIGGLIYTTKRHFPLSPAYGAWAPMEQAFTAEMLARMTLDYNYRHDTTTPYLYRHHVTAPYGDTRYIDVVAGSLQPVFTHHTWLPEKGAKTTATIAEETEEARKGNIGPNFEKLFTVLEQQSLDELLLTLLFMLIICAVPIAAVISALWSKGSKSVNPVPPNSQTATLDKVDTLGGAAPIHKKNARASTVERAATVIKPEAVPTINDASTEVSSIKEALEGVVPVGVEGAVTAIPAEVWTTGNVVIVGVFFAGLAGLAFGVTLPPIVAAALKASLVSGGAAVVLGKPPNEVAFSAGLGAFFGAASYGIVSWLTPAPPLADQLARAAAERAAEIAYVQNAVAAMTPEQLLILDAYIAAQGAAAAAIAPAATAVIAPAAGAAAIAPALAPIVPAVPVIVGISIPKGVVGAMLSLVTANNRRVREEMVADAAEKLAQKGNVDPTNVDTTINATAEVKPTAGSIDLGLGDFFSTMELDDISNLRYGLLFVLALSSLTVYSIILAGWSSNSKYAFLGALRSAAQMISYEVSISLALLPVILLSGSLNLTAIVCGQTATLWYIFPLLPIAIIFLVSMLAETNRTPFDLPEAEAELVAGYNVDYSSLPFAMFFLGEYANMVQAAIQFCLLFLGGWAGAVADWQEPFILTMKASVIWVFFIIVRAALPRYTYNQLMTIGWKMFLPFAGSFLILATGTVVAFDALPVVEEVAFDALYGVPAGSHSVAPAIVLFPQRNRPTLIPSQSNAKAVAYPQSPRKGP